MSSKVVEIRFFERRKDIRGRKFKIIAIFILACYTAFFVIITVGIAGADPLLCDASYSEIEREERCQFLIWVVEENKKRAQVKVVIGMYKEADGIASYALNYAFSAECFCSGLNLKEAYRLEESLSEFVKRVAILYALKV